MLFIIYAFVAVDVAILAAAFYFIMQLDKMDDEQNDDEKRKRIWR